MAQRGSSSPRRLKVKPFSAVHVDKRVSIFVIDQDLLCHLACSIDVFTIMRAEFEMNETQKSIRRCEEEDTADGSTRQQLQKKSKLMPQTQW